jgi:hypothetical protein
MDEKFKEVNAAFLELGVFLSELDVTYDLQKSEKITEIYEEFLSINALFENGLCAMVDMCPKCEVNEQRLAELVLLLKEASDAGEMSETTQEIFMNYMHSIPESLKEIKEAYLKSLGVNS